MHNMPGRPQALPGDQLLVLEQPLVSSSLRNEGMSSGYFFNSVADSVIFNGPMARDAQD